MKIKLLLLTLVVLFTCNCYSQNNVYVYQTDDIHITYDVNTGEITEERLFKLIQT